MRDVLLSRFHGCAALVAPERQDAFSASLRALADSPEAAKLLSAAASVEDDFWPEEGSWLADFRPYTVRGGILQVPVQGALLNGFPYQFGSMATGYEYIAKAIGRGLSDPGVKGIALLIDSPGGEVAGNFDLVDRMFASRGKKPIRAFAESAYSAAYSIASAADDITVTRSGGVGSVGVVTSHLDVSAALDSAGLKVTFIFAGNHKVDGNPYEPLPDAVRERIQARIDSLYSEFVALVARNRGLEADAVRATEALTYPAAEAVSIGFADAVGALDDAMTAFAVSLSQDQGDLKMSNETDTAVDQAALDAARAEGHAAGVAAERARINAIVNGEQADNRQAAAAHLAFQTDMTAEQATALLAKLPEEPKTEGREAGSLFESAMTQGNPELGALGGAGGTTDDPSATILADFRAATGRKAR